MVGRPLTYDEKHLTRIDVTMLVFVLELDTLLPMVHSFQLKCRLSLYQSYG